MPSQASLSPAMPHFGKHIGSMFYVLSDSNERGWLVICVTRAGMTTGVMRDQQVSWSAPVIPAGVAAQHDVA